VFWQSSLVAAIGLHWEMLKKTLLAGRSKTLGYKAPEIPRSESYSPVRRSDEG
jgi:hypothetical protein